jgi:signal transduction histidine kinase
VALIGSLEDVERLQDAVDLFSSGELGSSFSVVIQDRQGRLLASTAGLKLDDLALDQGELQAVLAGRPMSRDLEMPDGDEVRVRIARLTIGRDVVGVVHVAQDAELVRRVLSRLQTVLLVEGIGGVVLAMIIGYWLARGAVRPLQRVVGVAADIEASDLSRRINVRGGPAEVQQLADTFDAMLERLDSAFQQQRNFVLDMSHELRTPLTALRGNIDVLLMDKQMDPEVRSAFEQMSAEVARMIRLTSNLLYLAHADAGRELDYRPVELDVLCLEVYRQTKDLRPDLNYRLGEEEQVTVMGDRDLLKQMLLNLVDNSLKYTPAGGEVTLSLSAGDSQARLEVRDTGPGIEPDQIPLIFQRFYRARTGAQRGKGGAGIGLAISQWIVKAHAGDIQVESEPGKGSVFRVILPLDSRGSPSGQEPSAQPAR